MSRYTSDSDFSSATMEDAVAANPLGSKSNSLHAKVLQVELSLGVLVYDTAKQSFNFLSGGVPTCLFALEKTTAKCTRAALTRALEEVPGLTDFAQSGFKFQLRHSCTDRYTANIAAERALQQDYPDMELCHTFCDIHRLYTATKVSMATVESDVAGMLAFGVGFAETGSCASFQQALCRIFARKMVVYFTPAPTLDVNSKASRYQQDLMNLFLPITGVDPPYAKLNAKRRYVISYLLNGDWEDATEVSHYCGYGCCISSEATMKCFAMYLTWAICPRQIPIFPRSRWTQYDKCVDACGVLAGIHGLLADLMQELTGGPQPAIPAGVGSTVPVSAAPPISIMDDDTGGDPWDDDFCKASLEDAAKVLEQRRRDGFAEPQPPADTVEEPDDPVQDFSDYAKIKRQNKWKAKLWVQSRPFERLALIKEVFSILLSLMYHFLDISGKSFERRQRILAAKGHLRSYTVLEAAAGPQLVDHMQRLVDLLWIAPLAIAHASYAASLRVKRFTMTACALSSLHCLLRVPRQGFPYKLFTLLKGGPSAAEEIIATKSCMHDASAHTILKEFETWT